MRLFAQKEIKVKLRHYTLTKAGKEIFTLTEADKKQFIKQQEALADVNGFIEEYLKQMVKK